VGLLPLAPGASAAWAGAASEKHEESPAGIRFAGPEGRLPALAMKARFRPGAAVQLACCIVDDQPVAQPCVPHAHSPKEPLTCRTSFPGSLTLTRSVEVFSARGRKALSLHRQKEECSEMAKAPMAEDTPMRHAMKVAAVTGQTPATPISSRGTRSPAAWCHRLALAMAGSRAARACLPHK